MQTEQGRRAFVRNVMIGIPAVAGSASLITVADAAPAPMRLPTAGLLTAADRRIDAVVQQLADLYNEVAQQRKPVVGDARRAAEYIRSLATYRREAGRDALVTSAFQKLIEERGMNALIAIEPDQARMREALPYYGIDPTALTLGPITPGTRATAIERLSTDGLFSFYENLGFELLNLDVDLLIAYNTFCDVIRDMMPLFEAMAATTCLGALVFPPLAPECFAATVALTVLKIMSLFGMC